MLKVIDISTIVVANCTNGNITSFSVNQTVFSVNKQVSKQEGVTRKGGIKQIKKFHIQGGDSLSKHLIKGGCWSLNSSLLDVSRK